MSLQQHTSQQGSSFSAEYAIVTARLKVDHCMLAGVLLARPKGFYDMRREGGPSRGMAGTYAWQDIG